ncbi:hypothetical protein [Streptomyces noursei]|uniref:hypothetical protein n=1 Tax=Streptomyces noursei TaxID=1971 RepID=UPI000A8FAF10|nr:hypothetical protein [Streptomyces noursei]
MDLQGLGAIAAAGVAAVGVPAALLVGRWQMKAAVRTAEETGRAGIAQAEATARAGIQQAEATYKAALDAVRAEASAAQTQWRREARREAYATFLLAEHQFVTTSERLRKESDGVLGEERMAALRAAFSESEQSMLTATVIVELEGPAHVALSARRICGDAQAKGSWEEHRAMILELYNRLEDPDDPTDPRAVALAALAELRDVAARFDPSDSDHSLLDALGQARDAALHALEATGLYEDPAAFVLAVYTEPNANDGLYERHCYQLGAERQNFIAAARAELEGTGRSSA